MEKKISNVCKIVSEKISINEINKDNYISTENMLPNYGGVQKASSLPKYNVNSYKLGDILLSNIRPYFKKIWFASKDGGCSNDVLVIRSNNDILDKYLYYSLTNDRFINYYVASCKGTKMPRGNKNALLDWIINVPSLKYQHHIVNTIGSIDDLIDNYNKQVNMICLILKQSLLKYNDKITIDSYNPTIIKSGIKPFDLTKNYLDTSSVNNLNNIEGKEVVSYKGRPSRANMQPIANSIWFAKMKGSNKKLLISNLDKDLINNYVLSTGFLGIKESDKLPLSFLTAVIISNEFNIQRDLNSVGTTMAGVNNETFSKILVPKLSPKEVKIFNEENKCFIEQLSYLRKKINALNNIKTLLLNKYF